jgi:superfamily II DNA or RNA helicase
MRKGGRGLVIVPRKTLVRQAIDELEAWDLDVGAIAGGYKESRRAQIQVATYHSLGSRDLDWLRPDCTVLDEAHLSAFPKSVERWVPSIRRQDKQGVAIGVTATPRRLDKNRSLGEMFLPQNMVFAPSIGQLIGMGYLVRPTYVICPNAVTKKMLFDPDYVLKVYKDSDRRPTIVFVPGVPRAQNMVEVFREAGFEAALITANTSNRDRAKAFKRFNDEELPILVNVSVLREGVDLPRATNLILGIDPDSHSSYVQSIGRVLRPAIYKDGSRKTTATIYDLTGCVDRHQRVEELEYTPDDIELPDISIGDVPMKSCPSDSCDIKSFISATHCLCGCEFDINRKRVIVPEGEPYALLSSSERVHKAFYEEALIRAYQTGDRPAAARVAFYNQFGYTPPIIWRRNFTSDPAIEGWLLTDGLRLNADWQSRQLALPLDF